MQYQSLLVMMERAWKPEVEVSPTCPRCGSSNTKFCYYNNYSLTQPRYFCKGCRRYWTKGGSLRNIPVGGGCRKNRRGKSIRLSTDFMSSSSTFFRGTSSHLQPGLSQGSSSSSTTPPDIDLALVYANFLNPQPPGSNDGSRSETGQPSSSNRGLILHHPCTSLGMSDAPDSGVGLLEAGNGLFGWDSLSDLFADTHLNKDGNHITPTPTFDHSTMVDSLQQCGNEDMNYYISSHLPNEDIVSQETTASWSSPHHLLVDDHCMQAPEQPVRWPDHQVRAEDPSLSTGIGNRELDFPGEDTLPRK